MPALNGQGIYLSAYAGALPDQLSAADTAAVALSPTAPIIFVDTNFTLAMNYTLGSTLVAVGGILTTGANTLSCPFARGNEPLFDTAGTGAISFTAPVDWIDGVLFNPPTDGVTDCITPFDRWKNSFAGPGAKFRWPRGTWHTAYTSKFVFPTNNYAWIDASGAVLDSTFVYEGEYQIYIGCPSIGAQVRLTVGSVSGSFTVGDQVKIGTNVSGYVLAWNGTNTLTVGGFLNLGSNRIKTGNTITDVATAGHASITAIGYQIACGVETGNSGGGSSTSFVQYNQFSRLESCNAWIGITLGVTGTNTDGASNPSAFSQQGLLSMQGNSYEPWAVFGAGYVAIIHDAGGNNSFSNENVFNTLSGALAANNGFIENRCNQNTFIHLDVENNGASAVNAVINGLGDVYVNGEFDQVSANSINYTSSNNRMSMIGALLLAPPVAAKTQTITNITQAVPGVVTYTGTDPSNGDFVMINNVVGMTQLNIQLAVVASVNTGAKTFELHTIYGSTYDTSGFTAYTSGGTAAQGAQFVGLGLQGSGSPGFNNNTSADNYALSGNLTVGGDAAVTGAATFAAHTFLKRAGQSDFPSADVTFAVGSMGTTGHTLTIATSGFATSDAGVAHVSVTVHNGFGGPGSHLGGFGFTAQFWINASGTLNVASPAVAGLGSGTVTVTSVAASGSNIVVTFNSSSAISHCVPFVNYGDLLGTDLG
jgi:hypothetical protein